MDLLGGFIIIYKEERIVERLIEEKIYRSAYIDLIIKNVIDYLLD